MKKFNELELISKLRCNDQEAYNLFYKHFKPIVSWHIYHRIHNHEQAEELTQEVFLKFFNAIDSFDPEKSQLQTWILNIATNVYLDVVKYGKHNKEYSFNENESHLIHQKLNEKNPEILYLIAEKYDIAQVLIKMLPKDEYEVIVQKYLQGQSYQEIADNLNQSLSWVKIYIFKAKKRLLRLYRRHYE